MSPKLAPSPEKVNRGSYVTPLADMALLAQETALSQCAVPRIHAVLDGILRRSNWPELTRLQTIDVTRPGGLTVIECGDRCLIPTHAERRLQDYLDFFSDGDQIDVEVVFRVDDSNNNEIHIVRAMQEETCWPFPLSVGVRAFMEDIVRDQLSLEQMREER